MSDPRILLIRTSALGDVVHALPVLAAIKRHLPAARVAWLVEDLYLPILEGHPDLDRVIPVGLRRWRRRALSPHTLLEIARFIDSLQSFGPEVAIDLMGNHKGGILACLSLADRRLGLAGPDRREPSSVIWINGTAAATGDHAVDRMLSTLEALDLPREAADFGGERLVVGREIDPADCAIAEDAILIHPGAGWANKRYPPQHWGRVALELRRRADSSVGVLIAPGEERLATEVIAASEATATGVPALNLHTLAACLRRASLVIGGDTGPLHLADALGKPVLCLMGPTDPRRNGPYRDVGGAIWRQLPCSFCHKRYQQPMPCLSDLDPDAVVERALQRLQGAGASTLGEPAERCGTAGCRIFH